MMKSKHIIIKDKSGCPKLIIDSIRTPKAVRALEKIELIKTGGNLNELHKKKNKEFYEELFGKNYKIREVEGVKDSHGLPKIILENDNLPEAVKNLEKIDNNKC